ncbi:MAG: heavy metal-binding domain-containing protein, partial [Candidatus Paceibacterota bacterium]
MSECCDHTSSGSSHDVTALHQTGTRHVYTCPMHPEIEREAPGMCPECGMSLVARSGTLKETTEKTTGTGGNDKHAGHSTNEFL